MQEELADIRMALAADGYELRIDGIDEGLLRASIIALEGACEECLVQKELMKAIIQQSLPPDSGIEDIELRYPTD